MLVCVLGGEREQEERVGRCLWFLDRGMGSSHQNGCFRCSDIPEAGAVTGFEKERVGGD